MPTETEAKKLRCCDGGGGNCIGSGCMAWQWNTTQQNVFEKKRPEGDDWERIGNFWSRTPKAGSSYCEGYCGLLR